MWAPSIPFSLVLFLCHLHLILFPNVLSHSWPQPSEAYSYWRCGMFWLHQCQLCYSEFLFLSVWNFSVSKRNTWDFMFIYGYNFSHFLIVAGLPSSPGVHSNSRPPGSDRGWLLADGLGAELCHYCHADKSCGAWQGKESYLNEGPPYHKRCHHTLPVKLCSHLTITIFTWYLHYIRWSHDLSWCSHCSHGLMIAHGLWYIHCTVIL